MGVTRGILPTYNPKETPQAKEYKKQAHAHVVPEKGN